MESETHSAEEDFIGVSDVTIECNSPQNVIYITEFILTSQNKNHWPQVLVSAKIPQSIMS